jgi:uncharacterized membrane protein YfcA
MAAAAAPGGVVTVQFTPLPTVVASSRKETPMNWKPSVKICAATVLAVMACVVLGFVAPAHAVLGSLISATPTTSVSGLLVYVCIYMVNGQKVQVTLDRLCPATLEFR